MQNRILFGRIRLFLYEWSRYFITFSNKFVSDSIWFLICSPERARKESNGKKANDGKKEIMRKKNKIGTQTVGIISGVPAYPRGIHSIVLYGIFFPLVLLVHDK